MQINIFSQEKTKNNIYILLNLLRTYDNKNTLFKTIIDAD